MKIILLLLSCFVTFAGSENYMRNTLAKLASPEFQGRGAGSQGGKLATRFLEEEFKRFNLAPFGRGHRQGFTIFTKMLKNGNNQLTNAAREVLPFEPLSFSSNDKLARKDLVFVGYGITLPESANFSYDDYKGLDVAGKIVIVMTGDPGIGNGDSPFRNPDFINYRSNYYKLKNALAHKAAGILLINDPLSLKDPNSDPEIFFNSTDGGGSRFEIVGGRTRLTWVNNILKRLSRSSHLKSVLAIQKHIAKTQKPSSIALNKKVTLEVNLKKETGVVNNVIGVKMGTDPILKREVVVLGAHFDHLGFGGQSSMNPGSEPAIHFGADDNGSGTTLLLNLARELKDTKFKRTIVFALFNAEEIGLLGSAHLVKSWSRYEGMYGKIKYMLNFDMVGRFQKELAIMATGSAHEWNDHIKDLVAQLKKDNPKKLLPIALQKQSVGSSDHASFIVNEVPALFFSTGAHEDYHRPSDTADKIDYKSLEKIGFLAKSFLTYFDKDMDLTFNPEAITDIGSGRNRGYGSHLGCVPKMGQGDHIVGVMCTGTSTGSPAQEIGMRGGDILIKVGEVDIKSLYDLAFALKYYRAGDEVVIVWKRGEDILSKKTVLTKKGEQKHDHKSCNHDWENLHVLRNTTPVKL